MTVIIYNNISCWHTNSMRKDAIFWFVMLCTQNDACSSCLLRTQSYECVRESERESNGAGNATINHSIARASDGERE
jgi:hypothetical protein